MVADEETDKELVARWRDGCPDSAHMIVQRHYGRFLNLFYRLTGTRSWAEELTQDLFLRLTEQVSKDQPLDNPGAWLYTTALNLWRDHARREISARDKGIQVTANNEIVDQARAEGECSPYQRAEQCGIRAAVLGLEPRQREVVVLSHYWQLSYREIAAMLRIPVGTVRSRLFHALGKLRTLLVPLGEQP